MTKTGLAHRIAIDATGDGFRKIAQNQDSTYRQPMSATDGLFRWGMALSTCAFHDSYGEQQSRVQFGPWVPWVNKTSRR